MRVSIRRSERIYYGYGQGTYLACWNDYASTGGLLSIWEWRIQRESEMQIDSLIWHRENCVYYTRNDGIDIEVESFTSRKPGWITLHNGCGLCVPADHRHRIRSRSSEPVRLHLMRVPASDEDRRQVIELAEDIRPDLNADPLPDYWCAPYVERLSELKDVQLWPGLKPVF